MEQDASVNEQKAQGDRILHTSSQHDDETEKHDTSPANMPANSTAKRESQPKRALRNMTVKTKEVVGKSVNTAAGCVKTAVSMPCSLRQSNQVSSSRETSPEYDSRRSSFHDEIHFSKHGDARTPFRDLAVAPSSPTDDVNSAQQELHIPPIIVEEKTKSNHFTLFTRLTSRRALQIELVLLIIAAVCSILKYWKTIVLYKQVPLDAFGVWIAVAFCVGQAVPPIYSFPKEKSLPTPQSTTDDKASSALEAPDKMSNWETNTVASDSSATSATSNHKRKIFSSLNAKKLLRWQRTIMPDIKQNNHLYRRLLRNKSLRRRRRRRQGEQETSEIKSLPLKANTEVTASVAKPSIPSRTSSIGEYANIAPNSLADYVVEPLCQMRGMDIFLTDDCQADIGTHPWLIREGLRSVPTFCGNIMTPWGNVLMYYAMPEWVKDFNDIAENADDPPEIKAFKRFLNGTDEYRNERFKVIPSLADGPLPMRILAPAKKERLLHGDSVTLTWVKHNREEDGGTGQVLEPFMECQVDCLSNPSLRSAAGMFKKYLPKLVMDGAACIGPTQESSEPEPEACLAMWRWNHIDLKTCPPFPSRFERTSIDPDVVQASKLVRMSTAEVREILATEVGVDVLK